MYGTLAEETHPVDGVKYSKVNRYCLISKYSKNDPLREFTSSQAIVLPVIENVDQIYLLDVSEAQEVDATAEAADATDVKVTIWETELVKADVVAALNAMGVKTNTNIGDATLINKINTLSAEQETALKTALSVA